MCSVWKPTEHSISLAQLFLFADHCFYKVMENRNTNLLYQFKEALNFETLYKMEFDW